MVINYLKRTIGIKFAFVYKLEKAMPCGLWGQTMDAPQGHREKNTWGIYQKTTIKQQEQTHTQIHKDKRSLQNIPTEYVTERKWLSVNVNIS